MAEQQGDAVFNKNVRRAIIGGIGAGLILVGGGLTSIASVAGAQQVDDPTQEVNDSTTTADPSTGVVVDGQPDSGESSGVSSSASPEMTSAAAPAALATGTVTATPNTGLVNGQTITITYSGFPASQGAAGGQCNKNPITGVADCDSTNFKLGETADASGGGTFQYTVHTGTIGNGLCDADHDCYFVWGDLNGTTTGAALLQFASPEQPTTTTTSAAAPTTGGSSTAGTSTGTSTAVAGDALANTGSSTGLLAVVAVTLMLAGGVMLLGSRSRRVIAHD